MGHGGREFITPIRWHVSLPVGGASDTDSEVQSRNLKKKKGGISVLGQPSILESLYRRSAAKPTLTELIRVGQLFHH